MRTSLNHTQGGGPKFPQLPIECDIYLEEFRVWCWIRPQVVDRAHQGSLGSRARANKRRLSWEAVEGAGAHCQVTGRELLFQVGRAPLRESIPQGAASDYRKFLIASVTPTLGSACCAAQPHRSVSGTFVRHKVTSDFDATIIGGRELSLDS